MTLHQPINGNGVTRHFPLEQFQTFAASELADAPYWQRGICYQPECSKPFNPTRDWQMYCCKECEARGKAEFRRMGHRMALPLLLHRESKYVRDDEAVVERTRAARRYVTQAQSGWFYDRQRRAEQAVGK